MLTSTNPDSAHLCVASRDEIEEEASGKDQLNCPCIYGVHPAAEAALNDNLNHQSTNQPTARR